MTRTKITVLSIAIAISMTACTSTSNKSNVAVADNIHSLLCESQHRQARFVNEAQAMQLSKKDALKLYKLSGADKKDVVTGFAIAADRPPTVQRAIERLQDKPTENAFYIEVDIQNLGGLNQVLGHSGADKVYRQMASLTKQQIALLAADSCDFRHGGDEFSFIVTGEGLTISHVEHALSTASKNIKLYAEEQSLSDIVHPKHKNDPSKSGTGIIYGVSQLHAKAEIDTVFSTADTIVEKKKLQ